MLNKQSSTAETTTGLVPERVTFKKSQALPGSRPKRAHVPSYVATRCKLTLDPVGYTAEQQHFPLLTISQLLAEEQDASSTEISSGV